MWLQKGCLGFAQFPWPIMGCSSNGQKKLSVWYRTGHPSTTLPAHTQVQQEGLTTVEMGETKPSRVKISVTALIPPRMSL